MKTRYPKHKSEKQKRKNRYERQRNGCMFGEFIKHGLGRALHRRKLHNAASRVLILGGKEKQ